MVRLGYKEQITYKKEQINYKAGAYTSVPLREGRGADKGPIGHPLDKTLLLEESGVSLSFHV